MADSAPKTRNRKITLVAILVLVALIGGGSVFGYSAITTYLARFQVEDYNGTPGPSTRIIIEQGDTGEDVARKMVAADIVKSFDAIYREMLNTDFSLYPGTYEFPTKLSGAQALAILKAGENRVTNSVTIPEGYRVTQVLDKLVEGLGLDLSELEAALEIEKSRLPEDAVNFEGYLFPATYTFDPDVSASAVIKRMVDRTEEELAKYQLSLKDSLDLITTASIIQLEAGNVDDFYKVSRVIANRLEKGMLLQMDSTVNYGTNGTKITTSDAQRADPNPYNTYLYKGLPIGPIGNPGSDAIAAARRPADGDWLYFVTINLKTGETLFAETYAEHEKNAELFYKWLRENPDWND